MIDIALAIALIITNLFWAWQVHRLLNKLMSRNYGEYQEVTSPKPKKESKLKPPEGFYPEDLGALQEIQY